MLQAVSCMPQEIDLTLPILGFTLQPGGPS
jgi:hypothetical protein